MNEIFGFVNEKTKVLVILKENQLQINGRCICPLNQQEISNLVPCGKLKVNQILKELIDDGYVEMLHTKGRYIVTNKGDEVLKKLSLK
jgi:predicted transcriptional regulator